MAESDQPTTTRPPARGRWSRPSIWLPLGQLLLSALLIAPFRDVLFQNTTVSANGQLMLISRDGQTQEQPDPQLCRRLQRRERVLYGTTILNFPTSGYLDHLMAFFTTDHAGWAPATVSRSTWYAITWPILALPFWWSAGRGMEAMIGRIRRVSYAPFRRVEVLLAFIPLLSGIALAISTHFFTSETRDSWTRLFEASSAIWFLLGFTTVLAGILQLREKRARAGSKRHIS